MGAGNIGGTGTGFIGMLRSGASRCFTISGEYQYPGVCGVLDLLRWTDSRCVPSLAFRVDDASALASKVGTSSTVPTISRTRTMAIDRPWGADRRRRQGMEFFGITGGRGSKEARYRVESTAIVAQPRPDVSNAYARSRPPIFSSNRHTADVR